MSRLDTIAVALVALTILMALPRVFRHKGNFYKALAHVYVGWLFGVAAGAAMLDLDYRSLTSLCWNMAWALTGVEVVAFLIGLIRKRREPTHEAPAARMAPLRPPPPPPPKQY
jgi:hypothetical protein